MAKFSPLPFQKEAIDQLKETFVRLWVNPERQLPLILKSPTGSGKTFTSASFINELNGLPNWDEDKAFIWITFSDDLAMQSKDKFKEYFKNALKNNLLTVNDINNGKLKKNDILFLNWQKLVSHSAENRILRRPENPDERKESGSYWEGFIDKTHEEVREIILIVDEIHKNRKTALAQEIVDYINPKIIYGISATPSNEDELNARRYNSFIEVPRQRVVNEGLIKEKIVVTPNEDLQKHGGEDLDKVLLDLGIEKKNDLKRQFEELGKNINPLVLIQLPNDDKELQDRGEKTKEEVVTDYLREIGVKSKKIARWFTGHPRPLFIEENDDEHDFLLFKQAAGTGWDCPRAHVLIMFREISSHTFYAQTVGRILRMAEPQKKDDYKYNSDLRTGYLFTNYERKDIDGDFEKITGNKPFIHKSQIKLEFKEDVKDFQLESAFISRVDYGDLADSVKFQRSFVESMNKYFGITSDDIFDKAQKKLEKKGVDLTSKVYNRLIVDAVYKDFDQLSLDFKTKGVDENFEMSQNDIEKTFNFLCYQVLKEQTDDDARITNVARSWSPLKSALRVWFKGIFLPDIATIYRVFVFDILKGPSSALRPAITKSLKEYRPILNKILEERHKKQKEKEAPIFKVSDLKYKYTEDYVKVDQNNCVMDSCYLRDYTGRKNEEKFVNYIDPKTDSVKWWLKNGDSGKDAYSLVYFNKTLQKESLFYPDWIIQFKNGKVSIFDTKNGRTLNTEGRAKGLAEKLQELGDNYVGGIVRFSNGVWEYCDSVDYDDVTPSNNEWKPIEYLFN
ncbi:MAG: DEAD/DEAH box helicase family protein [Candidatus Cloacimonetes bacterium]|nr:DEAD/DEAH box helicase family protein [Candidatus Cloacimonadota bacterium]